MGVSEREIDNISSGRLIWLGFCKFNKGNKVLCNMILQEMASHNNCRMYNSGAAIKEEKQL